MQKQKRELDRSATESSKLTIEKSLDKLHHDYNSDSEEDESQNVTLEDLIAVTYGPHEDTMTLTQQIKSLVVEGDEGQKSKKQQPEQDGKSKDATREAVITTLKKKPSEEGNLPQVPVTT